MIIFFITLGVSTIVYGVYSTVKAIRNKKKRNTYKENVIKYSIKNKYPLQNNYSRVKNSLLLN